MGCLIEDLWNMTEKTCYYNPHPKDDGRLYFHKSLSANRGIPIHPDRVEGIPSFPMGVPLSFLMGVTPILPDRGITTLPDEGYPIQDWMRYPYWTGWGTPHKDRIGVIPIYGLDEVPPPAGMDGTWTGYAAGGTPLVVSHRRTFLLLIAYTICNLISI